MSVGETRELVDAEGDGGGSRPFNVVRARTLTGEFLPGAEPQTVKMMVESLFLRLSLTRGMRLKRTECAAISAASSQLTTEENCRAIQGQRGRQSSGDEWSIVTCR